MKNFALIGAAGYIAPRHLKAIHDTGNRLVAAIDPNDSVGVLDRYFPDAKFFVEIERFDRHLEKLRRGPEEGHVNYVSICTPNYLHDAHVRLALRCHAHAICEKPLVISPWNLDALQDLEDETGKRVFCVLQLRLLPLLQQLKAKLDSQKSRDERPVVDLTYVTKRGNWYGVSWKGQIDKSGGVGLNIGIHFFDLLLWLFGSCNDQQVHVRTPEKMAGVLELERAHVRWFLSIDENDLPAKARADGKPAFRSLTMDGEEIEFSEGFTDLHTTSYQAIMADKGFGIDDARLSIELVHALRTCDVTPIGSDIHPFLRR